MSWTFPQMLELMTCIESHIQKNSREAKKKRNPKTPPHDMVTIFIVIKVVQHVNMIFGIWMNILV